MITISLPVKARLVDQEAIDRLAARQAEARAEYRPENGWLTETLPEERNQPEERPS